MKGEEEEDNDHSQNGDFLNNQNLVNDPNFHQEIGRQLLTFNRILASQQDDSNNNHVPDVSQDDYLRIVLS